MKNFILLVIASAALVGCDLLGLDFINFGSEDKENPDLTMPKDSVYLLTDDIGSFESVFVTKDGYCMGIQKDTTFAYVAAIDSINGKGALVIYFDEIGKVRRLHGKDHTIDLSYNDDGSVNLWYLGTDGTSEVENNIRLSNSRAGCKMSTKAGDVFDPMDIATIALSLTDLKDIGEKTVLSEASNALLAADLLTTGPFSNTSTEVLTGVSSVAVAALIGGTVPIDALIAAINIANAAINDWQNAVAESYFGSAKPLTGDAVQLTDKHFVISYSIADVDPGKTDFNVGVIVADGLFITKNHNLYKKSIPYTSNSGRIIINIGELNPKKGDKFKYRVFIESNVDNGFKWDDMLLDYWRYGAVQNLVVDVPAIRVISTEQTNAEDNNGHSYTFDFNVNAANKIPFEVDSWGVAVYETFSETCGSNDDLIDSKSATGQGSKSMAFTVKVSAAMMNTDSEPYTPIINHFAVPYVSFDGHTYGIFENAVKVNLEYKEKERPTPGQWVDLGLPSGIKWAGWNVGASAPEEYGGYYAWGEIEEKNEYSFRTYIHREQGYPCNEKPKYHQGAECSCWVYSEIGDCISGTSYDVATVRWGGGARMPTLEDFIELVSYCDWEFDTYNGVNGAFVYGPNNNSIFIVNQGIYDGGSIDEWWTNEHFAFWTGAQVAFTSMWATPSEWYNWHPVTDLYYGFPVRPVSD